MCPLLVSISPLEVGTCGQNGDSYETWESAVEGVTAAQNPQHIATLVPGRYIIPQ